MRTLLKLVAFMSNNLPASPKDNKWPIRIMRSLGPVIASLSKEASEKYADHLKRVADVEVAKEIMLLEVRMYADLKKQLMEKLINATPAERFQIRKDIEDIDREVRKISIYQQAVEVIKTIPEENNSQLLLENSQQEDTYTAWIDAFNEYAKKQNEPWRQQLLAKALAMEAKNPGSIGQRALWLIGVIDQRSFNAFAALLNISIVVDNNYAIPNHNNYSNRNIDTAALGYPAVLGHVIFLINDLGLIGDPMTTEKPYPAESVLHVSYGSSSAVIKLSQELRISGILLTSLGETIASMYESEIDPLGKEIYLNWLETLKTKSCDVKELTR